MTEPLLLAAMNYHDTRYLRLAEKLDKKPGAETLLLRAEAKTMLASK